MTVQETKPYDSTWYPIPKGYAECPCCKGTGLIELTERERLYSWSKNATHRQCSNCGGQTMSCKALGYTKIDPGTGIGCIHHVVGRNTGRCYNVYTCTKCGYSYDIDSGD